MGELVEFPSNGSTGGGYLAPAHEGAGLGVVVIQDFSGLVDHIIDVCDRLSAEGFTALAPDLHHGRTVPDSKPDEAAKDLSGAIDFLQAHQSVRGHGVGVVGFGMGGGLAMWLATLRPDAVRAAVPFYGIAPRGTEPNWPAVTAAVEGHYGEQDDLADPESVAAFEKQLRDLGKDVRVFTYPGTGHAFFDDTRLESYDDEAARQAWIRTLEFLRAQLG